MSVLMICGVVLMMGTHVTGIGNDGVVVVGAVSLRAVLDPIPGFPPERMACYGQIRRDRFGGDFRASNLLCVCVCATRGQQHTNWADL